MASVPHALSFGLHPQVTRPKSQTLRVEHGTVVERPLPRGVRVSAEPEAVVASIVESKVDASAGGEDVPVDGKVLGFSAWYQEAVPESDKEDARVRLVTVVCYPEDNTLAIVEPPTLNSGLPQRKLLSRHKVPRAAMDNLASSTTLLPGGRHTDFITWRDLHVGSELPLYGKTYMLYACTPATRAFYEAQDAAAGGTGDLEQVPDDVPPSDGYHFSKTTSMARETGMDSTLYRGRKLSPVKRYMEASRGSTSAVLTRGIKDKSTQWREYGTRDALRFYGLLDESDKPFGDRLKFNVLYYLCDDMMELVEQRAPNDGRDRFSNLWKRARLPKSIIYQDSRSRDIEADKGDDDYYHYTELSVGTTINVMGRKVLLYGADAKTIAWYKEKLGLDMSAAVVDVAADAAAAPVVTPPEYLGYGTEEDSLGSFFSLQPRRPRKNWPKMRAYEDMILRFKAKFAAPSNVPDADREFTLSFFMDTDAIAIFEPVKKNSGIIGGKFLAKTRLRNPATGVFFQNEEFYVGATIDIRGFLFNLVSADGDTEKLLLQLRGTLGRPAAATEA